jgi:DNA-directed RNA polymerase subunit alpha
MTQNNQWTDFQMPNRLNVEQETDRAIREIFSRMPFERGFGTTIGNSSSRTSSQAGSAAGTAIKSEGDEHEFPLIKGVVKTRDGRLS